MNQFVYTTYIKFLIIAEVKIKTLAIMKIIPLKLRNISIIKEKLWIKLINIKVKPVSMIKKNI